MILANKRPQPPNPGSDEAIAQGCTCPVLDNGHGQGHRMISGGRVQVLFWMAEDCPLHGDQPAEPQPEAA